MDGTDLREATLRTIPEVSARKWLEPSADAGDPGYGSAGPVLRAFRARMEQEPASLHVAQRARSLWAKAQIANDAVHGDAIVVRTTTGPLGGLSGGPSVRLAYVGRERYHKDLVTLLHGKGSGPDPAAQLADQVTMFSGGAARFAAAGRTVERAIQGADVVAIEPFLRGVPVPRAVDSALSYYPYLRATLAVAETLDDQIGRIRSKGHQQKLRKAMKSSALTWRASKDPADFDAFYDGMYVPHARQRFGAAACVEPKAKLRALFDRGGDLVVVEKQGAPVAAALNYWPILEPGTVVYLRNGMPDTAGLSTNELGERNAFLELALTSHAIRQGAKVVDYDLTSAVLSDGVSTHKRRIGCDMAPGPYSPRFHLTMAPALRARITAANPFVGERGGTLEALVGFTGGDPRLAPAELEPFLRGITFPALARLRLATEGLSDVETAGLERAVAALAATTKADVIWTRG